MGGDLLRVNPLAEFICSVYGVPAGAALVRLRSLASSHRRYLVDVSAMDSKPLKAIPGGSCETRSWSRRAIRTVHSAFMED